VLGIWDFNIPFPEQFRSPEIMLNFYLVAEIPEL
jgi:hypothetical protein